MPKVKYDSPEYARSLEGQIVQLMAERCPVCATMDEREALRARVAELEAERADIDRLAGERYTPVSLAAHVASTRYDWEMAHTMLDEMGVPGDMTLGDRIQTLKL